MSALGRSYRSRQLPGGGAGFLVHRDEPGEAGSYSPSAGVLTLRPTDGELEQIPRRVHVPVDDQAARGVSGLGEKAAGPCRQLVQPKVVVPHRIGSVRPGGRCGPAPTSLTGALPESPIETGHYGM